MNAQQPPRSPRAGPADVTVGARLPASLTAPRRAREAIRHALAAWGAAAAVTADAELMASELVANAVEHGDGRPVDLYLRAWTGPGGRRGIACAVADTSPDPPRPRRAGPGSERGRGLAIVAALATDSGVTTRPGGKTAWFTLALPEPGPGRAEPEPELEAGA